MLTSIRNIGIWTSKNSILLLIAIIFNPYQNGRYIESPYLSKPEIIQE